MTSKEILKQWGFEPDKSVATMSEEQLYNLIKFTVSRIKETD